MPRGEGVRPEEQTIDLVRAKWKPPEFVDAYFGCDTSAQMQELFSSQYVERYLQYAREGVFGSVDELNEYLMLDTDTSLQVERAELLAQAMIAGISHRNIREAALELHQIVERQCGDTRATVKLFGAINGVAKSVMGMSQEKVIQFHGNLFTQALHSFLTLRLLSEAVQFGTASTAKGLLYFMEYNRNMASGGRVDSGKTYGAAEFLTSVNAYKSFLDANNAQVEQLSCQFDSPAYLSLRRDNDALARDVVEQSVFKTITRFRKTYRYQGVSLVVEISDLGAEPSSAHRDVKKVCVCFLKFLGENQEADDDLYDVLYSEYVADGGSAVRIQLRSGVVPFVLSRQSGDICPNFSTLSIGKVDRLLGKTDTAHESLRHVCLIAVKEYLDSKESDVESYIQQPSRTASTSSEDGVVEAVSAVGGEHIEEVGDVVSSDMVLEVSAVREHGFVSSDDEGVRTFWSDMDSSEPPDRQVALPLPRAMSGTDVYKIFVKLCGEPVRQSGSHAIFRLGEKTTPVPVKGHRRYGVGMLQKNLEMLGVSRQQFLDMAGYKKRK